MNWNPLGENFSVLLTVRLRIILVNDQIETKLFYFIIIVIFVSPFLLYHQSYHRL